MRALFWVGLAVSAVLWFLGDALASLLFPDGAAQFVFAFLFAVTGGGVVMLAVRLRALRSGRYEKAAWGIRRK